MSVSRKGFDDIQRSTGQVAAVGAATYHEVNLGAQFRNRAIKLDEFNLRTVSGSVHNQAGQTYSVDIFERDSTPTQEDITHVFKQGATTIGTLRGTHAPGKWLWLDANGSFWLRLSASLGADTVFDWTCWYHVAFDGPTE